MSDIAGILFDVDGVIADTAEFHYQAWKRIADDNGITFTREQFKGMEGVTRSVSLQVFSHGLDIDEQTGSEWMRLKGVYYQELISTLQAGDEMPGVRAILDAADVLGLKLGVGSASRSGRRVVEQLGLLPRFQVVADRNTVARGKPEPDVYLWAAGGLGLSPHQIIVFEDSEPGATAGKNGGFHVIGVNSVPLKNTLFTVKSLADYSLTELINRL